MFWVVFWNVGRTYFSIEFHWQFLFTNSAFWLVNILLQKFDTSSKNKIKAHIWMKKKKKKCQEGACKHEVAFFILNLSHWPVMQHAPNFRDMDKIKMVRNCQRNIFFSLPVSKKLKAIVTLFFSIFFQCPVPDQQFIPFLLHLPIKGSIFHILPEFF